MLSLPVTDAMTADDARTIAAALARVCDAHTSAVPVTAHPKAPAIASLLVIGGGPAGTALLNAATKRPAPSSLPRSFASRAGRHERTQSRSSRSPAPEIGRAHV